jgi:nucleotide-binding universal stress UspA family protein
MKKIIAAFDGLRFSKSTMQYAIDLAIPANAYLVGVFLDDVTYHGYRFSEVVVENGGVSDTLIQQLNDKDDRKRDESVELFKVGCLDAKVKHAVHRDRNVAINELLHESIFSDLLIVENSETFNRYEDKVPSTFMKDLLSDVQCPVLVVPGQYKPVEKILLLYDGEPSSVHAFKMLSYILPVLKSERTEVLIINSKEENLFVPDYRLIKEFTKIHFPLADYIILKGDVEQELIKYLRQQKENLLVVLGAYRRGRVSRWLKQSLADVIMTHVQLPLFIAHNK